jgi:hypothetical protein
MGVNAFELSIPPFLDLHSVFNVDLLQTHFPPLLDTLEVAEKLTPTELNLDCMEHTTIDQIMDTQVKGTLPIEDPTLSGCQSREATAPRQVAHQASSSA